jgi:hypothetical protein
MSSTSGRMQGNNVTIGGQTVNFYFIDWQIAAYSPSTNQTVINWQNYFYYTNSDAQLDDGDATVFGQVVYDVPGRVKNFQSNFTTRSHPISSGQITVTHNAADGTFSGTVSGSIGGSLSARSGGSANFTLPKYDRSPTTPSISQGAGTARNSAATTYTATASGGVNNNGPAVTWTLQSATNSAFTTGVTNHGQTTTNGGSVQATGLNANTTYWFRIRASNSDGEKFSSVVESTGIPNPPTNVTTNRSTTSNDRIVVNWSAPTGYLGSGISSYTVERSGTPSKTFTGVSGTSYTDTDADLIPGNSYTYVVRAVTSVSGGSPSYSAASTASASVVSPGIPYSPTSAPSISNVGLNITVVSAEVSGNGGVAINTANANEGYFVQYQLADTLNGTYGFDGVGGAWSPAVKMSNQSTRTHIYSLMTPAKFYKFRTYAANTVIYGSNGSSQLYYPHNNSSYTANFSAVTTGYFLSAGGKRWTGSSWIPTEIAKRVSGVGNITAATGNGTTVTYTATNTLSAGDRITVTGLGTASGSSLNLANVTVATATGSQFTVTNSTVGVSSGTGIAVCYKDLTIAKRYNGTSWVNLT